jgi:hypothetical protein
MQRIGDLSRQGGWIAVSVLGVTGCQTIHLRNVGFLGEANEGSSARVVERRPGG